MSAVQDAFVLDAVADDQSIPNKAASREAVRVAVNKAAKRLGGRVTAADLRRYYPPSINGNQIGPTLRRLRLRGYLVVLSHNARYGSKGNGDKHAPVYRVTGPIPEEAAQP